jgi:hydroxymethylbilane synthase
MLPAPAQGAIMVVCRHGDQFCIDACKSLNDPDTALCVSIERAFLQTLMGGCSTPISALASINNGEVSFNGNIVAPDGGIKLEIAEAAPISNATNLGIVAAKKMLAKWGTEISSITRNGHQ